MQNNLINALNSLNSQQNLTTLESLRAQLEQTFAEPHRPAANPTVIVQEYIDTQSNIIDTVYTNIANITATELNQHLLPANQANNMQAHGLFAQPTITPTEITQNNLLSSASMRGAG